MKSGVKSAEDALRMFNAEMYDLRNISAIVCEGGWWLPYLDVLEPLHVQDHAAEMMKHLEDWCRSPMGREAENRIRALPWN